MLRRSVRTWMHLPSPSPGCSDIDHFGRESVLQLIGTIIIHKRRGAPPDTAVSVLSQAFARERKCRNSNIHSLIRWKGCCFVYRVWRISILSMSTLETALLDKLSTIRSPVPDEGMVRMTSVAAGRGH